MRFACALVLTIALAGCGGGADEDERAQPRPAVPETTTPTTPSSPPFDPDRRPNVPEEGLKPAPQAQTRVVERWAAAVRRADFDAAADLFAAKALVQNGGAIEVLQTREYAKVWNAALPCGAKVTDTAAAGGYVVVQFVLVDRVGSSCGSGTGNSARVAMKVRAGRIAEWYRLPEPAAGPTV